MALSPAAAKIREIQQEEDLLSAVTGEWTK